MSESSEIGSVIRDYLDGMVFANAEQLRRAFHPKAHVIGHWDGGLEWSSVEEFIAGCEKAGGAPPGESYSWEIQSLEVVGDVALVKLAADYLGIRFTDYLSLLRENGHWRIVNKTFCAHPAMPN